jgi:microcystin-dependent protein
LGWNPVRGLTVATSPPLSANTGDTFFNSYTNQLFSYYNNTWNLIGPQYTAAQGVSGAIPVSVNDGNRTGVSHNIIQFQYGNVVMATLSSDNQFTPNPAIPGFTAINPGLTINSNFTSSAYGNGNVAAYLPTDPTIASLSSNIATLSSNVTTVLATTLSAIQSANAAVTTYINAEIATVNSIVATSVQTLNNTANAIVTNTNAIAANLTANINAVYTAFVANIATIDSGLSGVTAAWTANAATQQVQINNLTTAAYANSNVSAYLTTNTSTIKAPTQTYSDSSTNVATTAFVQSVLPRGAIIMWGGAANTIPTGWQLCNGSNGAPDLRDQFIVGAGNTYSPGATGGATSVSLTTNNLPTHSHSLSASGTTDAGGGHTHTASTGITDPGHLHTYSVPSAASNGQGGGGTNTQTLMQNPPPSGSTGTSATGITASTSVTAIGDHTHAVTLTGSTSNAGSSTAFSILPPYYALCYIQKMF